MSGKRIRVWLPAVRAGSGADIFTLRLAKALERRGIACEISWFALRYEFAPFLLKRVAPPSGTDIIFANSWNGFAFKRADIPLVVNLHHAEFDRPTTHLSAAQTLYRRGLIRRYELASFKAADTIAAVSQFAAGTLKHTAYAGKVEVIHNWIDTDTFSPSTVRQNEKLFRLLFVGKHSYLKGYDLLPDIMTQLGDGYQLDVAGRISGKNQTALPANIHSLGWLDEKQLIAAYQHADALLFPSRSEGFGYTALEAMSCGKPVITSRATALPELVDDGKTGILCAAGSVDEFTAACRKLGNDASLATSMGLAGREKALREFSEQSIIEKYESLIHRLINQR